MLRTGLAARASQATAQALTSWALLLHVLGGDISLFTVAFALTALSLPGRRSGSDRGRAKACFGSSLVLASLLGVELMGSLLGGGLATEDAFLLTATVIFSLAGGLYWVGAENGGSGGDAGATGYA